MGYAARMVGHALFGGPIGLVAAFIETAIEDNTGKDIGEHVVALFTDEAPAETMVAQNASTAVDQRLALTIPVPVADAFAPPPEMASAAPPLNSLALSASAPQALSPSRESPPPAVPPRP